MARGIISDLFDWYEKAELPIYQPDNLDLKITVADSLLCEDSVGIYLDAEGVEMGDPERVARCGGLAADVTGKTVEMLNQELL